MEFSGCDSFTLGVEWELQLLDCDTLDLYPGIHAVLESFSDHPYVVAEFIQSCVELKSPITKHSSQIDRHFKRLAADVLDKCQQKGMTLAGAGTHPFCRRLALITPLPRYEALAMEHGYMGQTQMTFANHVHVGMASGDEAIRVMRYLTPCLPWLIAISANSPFWRGHRTGYACYRRRLLAASRSYGIPPYFEDWSDFATFFDMARRSRAIHTLKDIHWDIRPHPDFGTLEIRVMDAQSTVTEVTFIAGLVRALAAWLASNSDDVVDAVAPHRLTPWIERENHFRASHWGLQAEIIVDEGGATLPLLERFKKLTAAVAHAASEMGEDAIARRLTEMDKHVPGYMLQHAVPDQQADTRPVVAYLRDRIRAELQPIVVN